MSTPTKELDTQLSIQSRYAWSICKSWSDYADHVGRRTPTGKRCIVQAHAWNTISIQLELAAHNFDPVTHLPLIRDAQEV
jgi:hypothetical protein